MPRQGRSTPFHRAASAIIDSVLRERGLGAADGSTPTYRDVIDFVLSQHRRMPDYLRPALRLATLLAAYSTTLTEGRPFHGMSHADRRRQVERWRASRFTPFRDLLRFYEGLAVFGWYSIQDE